MELIAKIETKLDLKPLALPFPYQFSWKRKSNGDEFWFTKGGTLKIWFGGLKVTPVGKIDRDSLIGYDELIKEMKRTKADVLRLNTSTSNDSYLKEEKLYTFTNEGLVEIGSVANEVLLNLLNEYEMKQHVNGWDIINQEE